MRTQPQLEANRETRTPDPFFTGPSQMHAGCRAFAWEETPIGPSDSWPVSLRTIVAMMLAAKYPVILLRGPAGVQLYNDAYIPTLGGSDRHPAALGMRAEECWRGGRRRDLPA